MSDEKENKPKILIIDDNPLNLNLLFELLNISNYRTLIATSGEKGIIYAQDAEPDIILLDILMPDGIDGFETCRRLKENPKTAGIPVFFMTALSEVDNKILGFKLGAADYITKPFQNEEVLARICKELTIQSQKKELQELNAAKDKFFSIIAHDLKSPLTGLILGTKHLEENYETFTKEDMKLMLLEVHKSSTYLFALLENLLEWSRSQTGRIVCEPERVYIFDVVSSAINLSEKLACEKSIRIINMVEPDVTVYADKNMIKTVFRNLLGNGLKFTFPGGQIFVSSADYGEHIEIAVADTGIGISEEDKKKLFRIDVKYSRLGTADEKGTGLGLILCKEFIEKNKGTIRVESEIGKGSRFCVRLPKP